MKAVFGLLLYAAVCAAQAQEIRPFVSGSLEQIRDARAEQPFVLAFWSLECAYCPQELAMLAEFVQRHPTLDVVLVATDAPEDRAQIQATLKSQGLERADAWVFADAQPERLRFEIDRRWHGELPRTYLYDATHTRMAESGVLARDALQRWVKEHVRRD